MIGKVTVILRGYNLKQVDIIAEVLKTSRYIKNIEITLNSENAYEIINYISTKYKNELFVGAGTVLTLDELKKAIKSGAKFVLSPKSMSKEMLDYCREKNVISIPGAFTPSEIDNQYQDGANIIKVFPANEVSLNYAKKVKEPLGNIPLMAVGGINKTNIKEAFNGGYDYVGSANGIFNKEDILNQNIENLKKSLIEFEKELI